MRILITTKDLSQIEEALQISTQIANHADQEAVELTILAYSRKINGSRAKSILPKIQKQLDRFNLKANAEICYSIPEIIIKVQQNDYDLVILVESCDFKQKPILKDPIPLRVEKHASCPVLILKGTCHPVRKILLCDSGADTFQSVMNFTIRLLDLLGGEHDITVLHVMSQISAGPGVPGKQLRATAKELIKRQTPEGKLLENDLEELDQPNIHPTARVRHGLVVEEIVAEANTGNYDLVVIGAHQQEGWQSFLLENIAEKIIKKIDQSVLVVKL